MWPAKQELLSGQSILGTFFHSISVSLSWRAGWVPWSDWSNHRTCYYNNYQTTMWLAEQGRWSWQSSLRTY